MFPITHIAVYHQHMNHSFEICVERLRPHQLRENRSKADIAFLPLGTLEWHGLHNPVGCDGIKAHHICCMAARHLGGGAVFPPLVLGVPRDSFDVGRNTVSEEQIALAFNAEPARLRGIFSHGGMDIQQQWLFYQQLLRMTLEQIAGFGFKSIYMCAGHQPLIHWAKPVGVAFARATTMAGHPITLDWGGEFEAAGLSGDHAGKWETSLMLASVPTTVDLSELTRHPDYLGVQSGRDAPESSREQGEAWAEACALGIAQEARWLIENYPKQPPARHGHRR